MAVVVGNPAGILLVVGESAVGALDWEWWVWAVADFMIRDVVAKCGGESFGDSGAKRAAWEFGIRNRLLEAGGLVLGDGQERVEFLEGVGG